jgi:DNA polymerase-3 subunit delta
MKLSGRAATRYFARPDPDAAGLLIYGQDAMRVAERRIQVVAALVGPNGEAEMRLTRLPGAEVRRDPAILNDATREQSFFPGPRVALVEDATDATAPAIAAALEDWRKGDAQIVVTAGSLAAKSALRKLFESGRGTVAIGIYNDPPDRAEIEAMLAAAGLTALAPDAMSALDSLARDLEPGDFRQTLEKLALYKLGDATPATGADIAAVAPQTIEAALDDMLHAVAESQVARIGPLMQRLDGQGTGAVGLTIAALRHFRALHAAAADPGGPAAGIARARPPIFGPRRDRMIRQARHWGPRRLDQAVQQLVDTDLQLRSAGQRAPQMALVERTLIRLAMMGQ